MNYCWMSITTGGEGGKASKSQGQISCRQRKRTQKSVLLAYTRKFVPGDKLVLIVYLRSVVDDNALFRDQVYFWGDHMRGAAKHASLPLKKN